MIQSGMGLDGTGAIQAYPNAALLMWAATEKDNGDGKRANRRPGILGLRERERRH